MRVVLIHNPNAGDENQPNRDELLELIRGAGHDVTLRSSKDEHLATLLDDPPELVAIAGGDGTVAKAGQLMVGRGIALAALPMGTANNIARTLGIVNIPVEKLIAGWSTARRMPFNVGLAS